MHDSMPSLSLDEMSWVDVAAHLARDSRLIVPVGAMEQHGPHLPLGSNALIVRRLAADLSREFGVLRAPTFQYGVNVRAGRRFAGTASLTAKTLHRALNELLGSWEDHGVTEFIVLTAHRHTPHLDALATLLTYRARVRVVEIWDADVSSLLDAQDGPLHAGEAETSLMLYLYPGLVRMDRARDVPVPPGEARRHLRNGIPVPPPDSAGAVGYPTAASAEKGERIYNAILDAVRRAVFLEAAPADSDTL